MSNVSTIVSTFNGLKLLQKNLPSVYDCAREGDEIIIADDKSDDLTVPHFIHQYDLELLEENEDYRLYQNIMYWEKKQLTLTLLANQKNLRFGANNNLAARLAKNDLIFILNNDCRPQKKCLKQLVSNFTEKNENKKLFAVTCFEKTTQENDEYQYHGKNKLWWQRGRFIHNQFDGKAEKWKEGETAWASGGSSLFDRKKFLELGGFDSLFYPAYWEDIDLSYQAKKKDWEVRFDPMAVVIHDHETTNKNVFGQKKMKDFAWKNGTKFIKKNATGKQKWESLLWMPYWTWKRHKFGCVFALLVLLTIITRFYQLGKLPVGMTWDEAAIGYNGWSVWQSRRDEWLERLPVAFRSFGDYKAPLAIYISGFFTLILGLTPWALRLPFAVAGVMAVWGIVMLLKEILILAKSKYPHRLSLLGGLIFSFTPWSFVFSRSGFESGMALCMIIWAIYGILNYLRTSRRYRDKWWQLGLVMMLIAGAMYVYHSSKITAPLILILTMSLWWRRKVVREMTFFLTAQTVWLGLLLAPLIRDSLMGNSLERANTLFINDVSMSLGQKIVLLITQIMQQFKLSFLIGGDTGEIVVNGTGGGWGVLLIPTLILCLIALASVVVDIKRKNIVRIKWFALAMAIILIGFLPAAMGEIIPHSNRALTAVLGFILLAIYGMSFLLDVSMISVWKKKSIWLTTLLIYGFFMMGFLHFYFNGYAKTINAREGFLSGYLEAAQIADKKERYVERIVFSDEYAQAYIFQLFAKKMPAINWRGGHLGKYAFLEKVVPEHFAHETTLFVVGPKNYEQFKEREIQEELFDEAGQSRWRVYLIEANV